MRVAILLNRDRPGLRTLAKKALMVGHDLSRGRLADAGRLLLPEYDSFAQLLDEKPLFLGMDEKLDLGAIRECNLLIWEWGWTEGPPRRLLEIRKQVDITTLVFPGPVDRFWREVSIADMPLHVEAGKQTHFAGVMSSDLVGYFQDLLPHARVFHLPVPVEVDRISALNEPLARTDPNQVLLTAPTLFAGVASQLPITTMLAFRSIAAKRSQLRGISYAYSDAEQSEAETVLKYYEMEGMVSVRRYARPLQQFVEHARLCHAGMLLSNAQIQGRMAMLAACIGVPMVVSNHIEAHRNLFPETSVGWYETTRAAELLEKLLDDTEFRRRVVTIAKERVLQYDAGKIRTRLLQELDNVGRRFG